MSGSPPSPQWQRPSLWVLTQQLVCDCKRRQGSRQACMQKLSLLACSPACKNTPCRVAWLSHHMGIPTKPRSPGEHPMSAEGAHVHTKERTPHPQDPWLAHQLDWSQPRQHICTRVPACVCVTCHMAAASWQKQMNPIGITSSRHSGLRQHSSCPITVVAHGICNPILPLCTSKGSLHQT